jgi:hypothetical protein
MTEEIKSKEEEVIAQLDTFDELPDAPPKRRIKLSWVGKLSVAVVVFWLIIVAIGPYIAPFHEMDMECSAREIPLAFRCWPRFLPI